MPRRASKWVLHEKKNGTWDLSRGGRYLYSDLRSKAECIKRMKVYYRDGEPVVHEEPDGYQTNITADLKKKRII